MSPEGIILTWNKGCVKLKQWSVEEAVGKHYRMLFMDEDQKEQRPEKEIEHAINEGSFEEYNWRKKKMVVFFGQMLFLLLFIMKKIKL